MGQLILVDDEWVYKNQCCIDGCENDSDFIDIMGNMMCEDCVQQELEEDPTLIPDDFDRL